MTWFWYSDTYSHGYYCQANNWCFIWLTYFVPASPYSSRNKGGLPRPPPRLEACPWWGLWWIPRRSAGSRRRKKHSGRCVLFSDLKLFFLFWMFLKSGLNSLWLCWKFRANCCEICSLNAFWLCWNFELESCWLFEICLLNVCWPFWNFVLKSFLLFRNFALQLFFRFEISRWNRSYYEEMLHLKSFLPFWSSCNCVLRCANQIPCWNLSYHVEIPYWKCSSWSWNSALKTVLPSWKSMLKSFSPFGFFWNCVALPDSLLKSF